jgi:hypothetical protein
MSEGAIQILNDLNVQRLNNGQFMLVPNSILNSLAEQQAQRLRSQGTNPSEVYPTGRTLEEYLLSAGYPAYGAPSDNYAPDMVSILSSPDRGNLTPDNFVSYWIGDPLAIPSYRRQNQGVNTNPIFSPYYREIGISHIESLTTGYNYFVIIFASQPNALPVVAVDEAQLATPEEVRIETNMRSGNVVLIISNEFAYPDGGSTIIRISLWGWAARRFMSICVTISEVL